ncbi:MAG: TraR/DksA family transcriptional regulator [Halomonas sp.]|nr:TraR/DksA family transcriptional regulator [Halomonas sp.]
MTNRKGVLEGLREELIGRIERYRAHKEQRSGPLDKDMEEQAIELQNDEVVDALESESEEDEEPIAPGRLDAVPFTTLCRQCAELR